MMFLLNKVRLVVPCLTGMAALALIFTAATPASAACGNRGKLDVRFCDDNGDLVADTPADKSKWLNPSTLVFSYTPVEGLSHLLMYAALWQAGSELPDIS